MAGARTKHPIVAIGRRFLVIGGVCLVLGLVFLPDNVPGALACLAFGVLFAFLGLYSMQAVPTARLLGQAHAEAVGGHFDRAGELLDGVEARARIAVYRAAAALQRARIAVATADMHAAVVHLDTAIETRLSWLTRTQSRTTRIEALGLRAFVRAAMGNPEAAGDARAVLRSEYAGAQAVARARFAEAVMLRGDEQAQRQYLEEHGALMLEALPPRERMLYRALRRSGTATMNAYRLPAERPAARHDRQAWADEVLPGAGELVEPAAPGRSGALALSGDATALPRKRWRILRSSLIRFFVLWVVLIVAFLAIWQFLSPHGPASEPAPEPQPVASSWPLVGIFVVLVVLFLGFALWRARRSGRVLLLARRRLETERSADARAALERLAGRKRDLTSVSALLLLALDDERIGDFQPALARCAAALARLERPQWRARTYDYVAPELHACRARAMAALGHERAAMTELALLERDYPMYAFLESARRSVHLVVAARRGDFERAAGIARSRDNEYQVSLREEDLGELACLQAGEPFTRERKQRLRAEIDGHPGLRPWLERVAPQVLSRLSASPG